MMNKYTNVHSIVIED